MLKKLILLILLITTSGIQTGCTKENELGDLSVVTGLFLGVDQNHYIFIADCMNFSGEEGEKKHETKPIRVKASSLQEGFSLLKKESQTPLYFFRTKVLLLGKNFSEYEKTTVLEELLNCRIVPADISVLQADFPERKLLSNESKSFGLTIEGQLQKDNSADFCKLYQLLSSPAEKTDKIPTVSISENGFYLKSQESK